MSNGQDLIDTAEAQFCIIGTIALPPWRPHICFNPNEVYACAYGEARCDGHMFCATQPCHWR